MIRYLHGLSFFYLYNISPNDILMGKVKVKVTQSCPTLYDPMDYTFHGILQARIREWVAFPFSRVSSKPRDHSQVFTLQLDYQLSHKGSPRILEWVAYPFSSGSSRSRNWTRVSCIAGGFFTNWAIREAQRSLEVPFKIWNITYPIITCNLILVKYRLHGSPLCTFFRISGLFSNNAFLYPASNIHIHHIHISSYI